VKIGKGAANINADDPGHCLLHLERMPG